jgi:hypothetical protein
MDGWIEKANRAQAALCFQKTQKNRRRKKHTISQENVECLDLGNRTHQDLRPSLIFAGIFKKTREKREEDSTPGFSPPRAPCRGGGGRDPDSA